MIVDQTIAIIGAGNMGKALIGGLVHGTEIASSRIRATRRSASALDELSNTFPGVQFGTDNTAAVRDASVVVLAVKPQNIDGVIAEIRTHLKPNALVISILAGITTRTLAKSIGHECPVVRAMPNTPALVNEGSTAIVAGRHATGDHLTIARQLFEAVGMVEIVPEELLDAVTGLSGSGPAYVYMVIEAMTDGGVKQGLPRPVAHRLAAQTVYGASKLVIDTKSHPAILRDEVTTPGGTAIAAVADLEKHGLRTMLINAVATAADRSRQLSKDDAEEK